MRRAKILSLLLPSPSFPSASPFYLCGQQVSDCRRECAACLPIWLGACTVSECLCVSLRGVFPFCISHKQDPPSPLPSVSPPDVQFLHPPVHSWTLSPSGQRGQGGDYGSGWLATVSRDSVGSE